MNRLDQIPADVCAIKIGLPSAQLEGILCIPSAIKGIVIFAHGSGSSRLSPRNQFVAQSLHRQGIGTLLFDLLTAEEDAIDERTAQYRFNIRLLADRLVEVTDWLPKYLSAEKLVLGYFGASTGAAAALVAAAEHPQSIKAVVSRGGRPDLAMDYLDRVQAPTLLIVGGRDFQVIEMNRTALSRIQTDKALILVLGATHLFEEPGALEEVSRLASSWFLKYFASKK